MSDVNKQLLDALKLADAMLSGANMNANVVERKVKSAIAAAEQAQRPCQYCNGTGDVHSITGEWSGVCSCEAGKTRQAKPKLYPIDRVLMDADHLANTADQLLLAIGKLACAEVDDDSEFHAETVEQYQSEVTDWTRAIVSATHEYRKRAQRFRDSLAESTPAEQAQQAEPVALENLDALDAHFSSKIDVYAEKHPSLLVRQLARRLRDTAKPPAVADRDAIRRVFMAHGFTIKDGQTDLKPYVYEAAEALLCELSPAVAVPDEIGCDAAPWMSADTEPDIAYRDGWNACRAAMLAAAQKGGA